LSNSFEAVRELETNLHVRSNPPPGFAGAKHRGLFGSKACTLLPKTTKAAQLATKCNILLIKTPLENFV
jgi:hypothetical protein